MTCKDRSQKAGEMFSSGFSCAQSVFASFAADLELDKTTTLKIASTFGGGVAKTASVCGAVTGALMVIGLKYGSKDIPDQITKEHIYGKAHEFIKMFRKKHGSIICRELLGYDISTVSGKNMVNELNLSEKLCNGFVEDTVKFLEKIIG